MLQFQLEGLLHAELLSLHLGREVRVGVLQVVGQHVRMQIRFLVEPLVAILK